MLNLLRSEEYSVREYAQHSIMKLVESLNEPAFLACEKWLLTQIKINNNEMVMKSILGTYRFFINMAHASEIEQSVARDLFPLVNTQKNEEDFFTQILSM